MDTVQLILLEKKMVLDKGGTLWSTREEAFGAVGYSTEPEGPSSFAEASFFAHLVGSDVAVASAHNKSIKYLSGNARGIELAARCCFLLEDPQGNKEPTSPEIIRSHTYDNLVDTDVVLLHFQHRPSLIGTPLGIFQLACSRLRILEKESYKRAKQSVYAEREPRKGGFGKRGLPNEDREKGNLENNVT